jgi:hypothetical protein
LRVIKAHTMHAILLANTTVTSLTGRRTSADRVHAPSALVHFFIRKTIGVASSTSILRISGWPALVNRPRRLFPPVEFCRDTSPSQATATYRHRACRRLYPVAKEARCRSLGRKRFGSGRRGGEKGKNRMCGLVGVIGSRPAAPIVLGALRRLRAFKIVGGVLMWLG